MTLRASVSSTATNFTNISQSCLRMTAWHPFRFITTCGITSFTAVVTGCIIITLGATTGVWRKSWTTADATGVCSTFVVAIGGNWAVVRASTSSVSWISSRERPLINACTASDGSRVLSCTAHASARFFRHLRQGQLVVYAWLLGLSKFDDQRLAPSILGLASNGVWNPSLLVSREDRPAPPF